MDLATQQERSFLEPHSGHILHQVSAVPMRLASVAMVLAVSVVFHLKSGRSSSHKVEVSNKVAVFGGFLN